MDLARCSKWKFNSSKWSDAMIFAKGGTKMNKSIVNKLLFTGVFCLSLLISIDTSYAETSEQSYDSNTGVGFYGEYEFPKDPIQEDPITPEEPIVPEEPKTNLPQTGKPVGEPGTGIVSQNPSYALVGNGKLPQTGVKQANLGGLGLVFLAGAYVFGFKKIKQKKGEI